MRWPGDAALSAIAVQLDQHVTPERGQAVRPIFLPNSLDPAFVVGHAVPLRAQRVRRAGSDFRQSEGVATQGLRRRRLSGKLGTVQVTDFSRLCRICRPAIGGLSYVWA